MEISAAEKKAIATIAELREQDAKKTDLLIEKWNQEPTEILVRMLATVLEDWLRSKTRINDYSLAVLIYILKDRKDNPEVKKIFADTVELEKLMENPQAVLREFDPTMN